MLSHLAALAGYSPAHMSLGYRLLLFYSFLSNYFVGTPMAKESLSPARGHSSITSMPPMKPLHRLKSVAMSYRWKRTVSQTIRQLQSEVLALLEGRWTTRLWITLLS
jgi:hypothetical protein